MDPGALTVEGKIGNFDVTYAGSLLRRRVDQAVDYSDYAYFYDKLAGYVHISTTMPTIW